MRRHEEFEVGRRAARGLMMENWGSHQRRSRWVVSEAAIALALGIRSQ